MAQVVAYLAVMGGDPSSTISKAEFFFYLKNFRWGKKWRATWKQKTSVIDCLEPAMFSALADGCCQKLAKNVS